MNLNSRGPGRNALASLRQLVRPRADQERCDLCGAGLGDVHDHLLDPSNRQLICACEPCAILFSHRSAAKFRRVPRGVRFLPDFRMTDMQWEGLGLPIHLAFFLHNSAAARVVVYYPSPAGTTEAPVPPESWQELADDNPFIRELQPDVEALLVNRVGTAREHYRAGIDECYKLAGILRTQWRGMSGGTAVWEEIGRFFAGLRERSGHAGGAAHA